MKHIQFFLRYAVSCAYVLRDGGFMSDAEYKTIEEAALTGKDLPTKEIERLFPAAYRRLCVVAKEHGKNPWDPEVVMRYFPKDHNHFIDKGDGTYATAPAWFKEHCKVKSMKVLEKRTINDRLFLRVKDRWVQSPFFSDVEVGDTIVVHHSYAVERTG